MRALQARQDNVVPCLTYSLTAEYTHDLYPNVAKLFETQLGSASILTESEYTGVHNT